MRNGGYTQQDIGKAQCLMLEDQGLVKFANCVYSRVSCKREKDTDTADRQKRFTKFDK
jgi:hypothetical protein